MTTPVTPPLTPLPTHNDANSCFFLLFTFHRKVERGVCCPGLERFFVAAVETKATIETTLPDLFYFFLVFVVIYMQAPVFFLFFYFAFLGYSSSLY